MIRPRRRQHRPPDRDAGMSLAELLVSMMLLGVLGGLTLTAMITLQRDTRLMSSDRAGGDNIQQATEPFSRDLRQAGLITVEGSSSVSFWVDLNSDYHQSADELVTWALSSGGGTPRLCRTTAAQATPGRCLLLPTGSTASFSYDSATPGAVRTVTVVLAYPGLSRNESWKVRLRNVG